MDREVLNSSKMTKQAFRLKLFAKRYVNKTTIFSTLLLLCFGYFFLQMSMDKGGGLSTTTTSAPTMSWSDDRLVLTSNVFNNLALRNQMLRRKVERLKKSFEAARSVPVRKRDLAPNERVHAFYYAWYANPEHDGGFHHWKNHSHIASNYFPALGSYSSRAEQTLTTHMRQLRDAGVGVLVVAWTPPNFPDTPADLLPTLFDTAAHVGVRVALHVQPYAARHPANLRAYLEDFLARYATHPALYRDRRRRNLPVFYVADSHLEPEYAWRDLLAVDGARSVRGTALDGIFLGLLADLAHRTHVRKARFDGFYTRFAANGFTYGSTWKNWRSLADFARQHALLFSPTVGPGFVDTHAHPSNAAGVRHRRHGQYYDVAWRTALAADTPYVSISSFNEWHEGTQIEPAVSRTSAGFTYLDYAPEGPQFYMNLTQFWVEQYEKAQKLATYKD